MYQSEQIESLAKALAAAQGEMGHASKGAENPYFKSSYADLPAVIDAAKPHLAKHGLSVVQFTTLFEGALVLVCQLNHSSGQWIRGMYPINPVKQDPQGYGSAITYARRYTYASITGVAAAGEDDDGNAASNPKPKAGEPVPGNDMLASDGQLHDTSYKGNFANASIRKTYQANAVTALENCETMPALETAFKQYWPKIQNCQVSPNQLDRMAAEEIIKAKDRQKLFIQQQEAAKAGMPQAFNDTPVDEN